MALPVHRDDLAAGMYGGRPTWDNQTTMYLMQYTVETCEDSKAFPEPEREQARDQANRLQQPRNDIRQSL